MQLLNTSMFKSSLSKKISFLLVLLCPVLTQAQQHRQPVSFSDELVQAEDSLKYYLDSVRKTKVEKSKYYWNNKFRAKLEKTLELNGAFDYPFDKLTTIGKMLSPDKYFRLFNWNVENADMTQNYFGYFLVPSNRKEKVIELSDRSAALEKPESLSLNNQRWYGCLYYKIILSRDRGKKEYTLLGFDMNNPATKKRIVEVVTFSGDKANFGMDIFSFGDKTQRKRVVFEHSAQVQMALRWEEDKQRIVFDHLEPISANAEGLREFYFPDGSYDALALEDGRWVFKPQVEVANQKSKLDKLYNAPEPAPNPRP